jgi:uncharacterized protein YbjT (DUF2867 family)
VDFDYPLALARRAAEAGAASFVLVSSVGSDPYSNNFYLRVKGELESAVGVLPLRSLHILRPSLLLGNRSESRSGESIARVVGGALAWAFIGPLSIYRPVESSLVARAMIGAANCNKSGRFVYHFEEMRRMAEA